ncbi:MAG: DUF4145 domain-containing protein [Alphaproteobacteria bacterium]
MTSISIYCPHCMTQKIGATLLGEWELQEPVYHTLWQCNGCQECIVIKFETYKLTGKPQAILEKYGVKVIGGYLHLLDAYPKPRISNIVGSLPSEIEKVHAKALDNFDAKRDEEACMLFRKTLDLATSDLLGADAKGQKLNNRIDMLASGGRLTSDLAQWAHTLRSAGNDFVHDQEPTRQDAEDLELLLRMFLIYCYELPSMLDKRKTPKPAAAA